ncbi:MAG: hypothetical protein M1320_00355 [Patescibacteria group bacterium]|nr:hypothetical protein [Patescibacteria group bacterium]
MPEKHIIGMTQLQCEGVGIGYPQQLDKTIGCCKSFEDIINRLKYPVGHDYFNTPSNYGIYLKHISGGLGIYVGGKEVNFCPFCGGEIEIKIISEARVIPQTKIVPDGYKLEPVPSKNNS